MNQAIRETFKTRKDRAWAWAQIRPLRKAEFHPIRRRRQNHAGFAQYMPTARYASRAHA